MECDEEDNSNMNLVMELKETTEMTDGVKIPVEAISIDQASCDRLLKLPSPKVSASRTGVESTFMD